MEITFSNKKLEKLVNNDREMVKELGSLRAKTLKKRLTQLMFASHLEEVRLIFKPQENPIPTNADGQYMWIKISGIEVIEIINYHKEN